MEKKNKNSNDEPAKNGSGVGFQFEPDQSTGTEEDVRPGKKTKDTLKKEPEETIPDREGDEERQ